MSCDTYIKGESAIRRIDPRYRVLFALAFSLLVAVAGGYAVLLTALTISAIAALSADLPARPVVRRLIGLNALTLTLFLLLPLSTPGDPLFSLGALAWSRQGMLTAGAIALKANTIVLAYTALVSTVDPIRLGGALQRLRVPAKLVQLLLFTIRYIDVVHHEYDRLVKAMRVRCFRPGFDLHTFRTYGYLVGMLLVNSFDRSDRIVAAMKCRGFNGRFHSLAAFSAGGREAVFALMSGVLLIALGWLEWA